MARTTRQESEATAARILDCARVLFARRGFAAVGLDEIAGQAGVTRGAVYHHYASRIGVFRAVHAWAQAEVAESINRATACCTDPWQALESGCHAFLEASVREDLRQILLLDAPAALGWAAWRDQDARHSGRLLTDVLTELARTGVIAVESVPACQALLSGAMNEAALWAAAQDDAATGIADAWPTLRRMLAALRGTSAAGLGGVLSSRS
jgi:AcrR family transcriptional regulator